MPESIPDAPTLLGAAVKYLEDELLPSLDGYHRFKTRVTVNVLNTVRRELEMRGAQAEAERARLAAILGHDGEVEVLERGIIGAHPFGRHRFGRRGITRASETIGGGRPRDQ